MEAWQRDADGRPAEAAKAREQGGEGDTALLLDALGRFDVKAVTALVAGGADRGAELADGTTPLVRAVDTGSPAVVQALLGEGLQVPEAEQRRVLDLARHWFETGAVEELRRRTGETGPTTRRTVEDEEYSEVEELTLGGLTVRDGHGAVLTVLEEEFGVRSSVADLAARVLPYRNDLDANWSTAAYALFRRKGPLAWSELVALRTHPDPTHRRLLAHALSYPLILPSVHVGTTRERDFLASWALGEPDGWVLAGVLNSFAYGRHADKQAIGLRYADHPDPRVRREVPDLITGEGDPFSTAVETALLELARDADPGVRSSAAQGFHPSGESFSRASREALLTLVRDADPDVRASAAATLAWGRDRTPAVLEALVALMDEEDQALRLEAAFGLAHRGDPRAKEAYELVGPLGPEFGEHDHRVEGRWRFADRYEPDRRQDGTTTGQVREVTAPIRAHE